MFQRNLPTTTTDVEMTQSDSISPGSPNITVQNPRSEITVPENFTVVAPKSTSPLITNRASSSSSPPPSTPKPASTQSNNLSTVQPSTLPSQTSPIQTNPSKSTINIHNNQPHQSNPQPPTTTAETPAPRVTIPLPPRPNADSTPHVTVGKAPPVPTEKTMAERLRKTTDRSLKRLAPTTIAESERPRVVIPDEVFQRGADLHKDFIICYFNGRPPPYFQIQSVLNHMRGKGRRLEIHVNHLSGSMLVRIPNDFIRQKILEKCIWYVGDSMFHTAQWSSHHSADTPALVSIPIWVHLFGIPLDLRSIEGLSLVAGLVGEPKETDEFTINLVSLKVAHAKVEVDLTKPLPNVVEFQRQNGQVVEVEVKYPWLPSSCSHCKELGHIVRNCLHLPPPPPEVKVPSSTVSKDKQKGKSVSQSVERVNKSDKKVVKSVETGQPSYAHVVSKSSASLPEPSATPAILQNLPSSSPALQSPITSSSQSLPSSALPPRPSDIPFPSPFTTPTLPLIVVLPATITPSGLPYPHSPPPDRRKIITLKRSRSHPSLNSYIPSSYETLLPSPADPNHVSNPETVPPTDPRTAFVGSLPPGEDSHPSL